MSTKTAIEDSSMTVGRGWLTEGAMEKSWRGWCKESECITTDGMVFIYQQFETEGDTYTRMRFVADGRFYDRTIWGITPMGGALTRIARQFVRDVIEGRVK